MSRPYKHRLYGIPHRLCSEGERLLYKVDYRFRQMRDGQSKSLRQETRDKHRHQFSEQLTIFVSHTSSCSTCRFDFVEQFDDYIDDIDLSRNHASYQDPLVRIWGTLYSYCTLGYVIAHGFDSIKNRHWQALMKNLKTVDDYEKRMNWAIEELKKHIAECKVCMAKFN